jgi:hypothetical protein
MNQAAVSSRQQAVASRLIMAEVGKESRPEREAEFEAGDGQHRSGLEPDRCPVHHPPVGPGPVRRTEIANIDLAVMAIDESMSAADLRVADDHIRLGGPAQNGPVGSDVELATSDTG